MAFEVFDSRWQRPAGTPTISIRPKGAIRLNVDATRLIKSKGFERVLLLWDREKRKLAISSAPELDKRAYRVTYSPTGSSATIGAKAFPAFIGLAVDRSVSLPAEFQTGMLQATIPAEYLGASADPTERGRPRSKKNKPENR